MITRCKKVHFCAYTSTLREGDEMGAKNVTAARQKRKQELVYVMGGKCVLCGYDRCIAALEFHHIDKSQKERQLSSGNCYSWDEDIEEVKKCALVCSNCHREIEAFNLTVSSSFDEARCKEITEKKNQEKTINQCRNCGKEIDRQAYYCSECWYVLSRKTQRPYREELKHLIRDNSFTSIAQTFNVSDNTIRKWCKSYNLPHKTTDIKLISHEDWQLI